MGESCNENLLFNTNSMRDKRKTWSLRNDVELLKNLESFSQNLIKKTHLLMDSLEKFQSEINWTSVDVKTLSNNFEGISETQFVEKRVYDEEDMICEEDNNKNDSTSSGEKNKLQEALQTCAKELESRFEAVKITMNDSDEDDIFNKGEIILIPKDRYKSRLLPELKDFYSEDHYGLSEDLEDAGEVEFNDNDDDDAGVNHLESPSTDDVDNLFQKNNFFANADSEIKSVNVPEKSEHFLAESIEEEWKESNEHVNEIINDHVKKPELQLSAENSISPNFHNATPGESRSSAIVDEIKSIFGEESTTGQAKLPVFNKRQSATYKGIYKEEKVHQVNESSSIKENDCARPASFKSNDKSLFSSNNPNSVKLAASNTYEYIEDKCEESILPNVRTEVLHSFAKSRAKIKGKRRLPTRRLRNISQSSEMNSTKQETRDSNILSPSTDEEDLFVIPNVNIPKETSADYLFGMPPTLFSPSSSSEAISKDLFHTRVLKKKECSEVDRKKEKQEVEIKKSFTDSEKNNSTLFSDWDPFNSEESDLFSSLERKVRKTKLFDDFDERATGKALKHIDDDDLFSFADNNVSNTASSLFAGSSTDNFASFPSNGSELFIESKNNSSTNLFSITNNDDLLFGSSNGNERSEPDNIQDLTGDKMDSKENRFQSILCPNPLMDTEDDLFD